ncbi:MAG: non-canonical purine NTP pyrophosphatase [Nanoarchaeota archaeon]|nr:non-canonical purine NTP pyrophosphatase [Nanoarchaeota archaeon]
MKTIYFVTGNQGKFIEVKQIMSQFNIKVKQIKIDKPEIKSNSIKEIAEDAAKNLAKKLKKPIVCEDTGFFLKAYHNFPGAHPKFIYDAIGLKGLYTLLKNKNRNAYFMTVAAYCTPSGKPKSFSGIFHGQVSKSISKKAALPGLPYDKIFIPQGYSKTWAELPEAKNKGNHRKQAFEKLARYLNCSG